MANGLAPVWYTAVYYGNPNETIKVPFPGTTISREKDAIQQMLDSWQERAGQLAGGELVRCSVRIYGYSSPQAARRGSIADEIGKGGRVE